MNEEPREKKEFLKREEIRTMRKDIERLREIEAQKERERIAALKVAKIKKPPEAPEIKKKAEEVLPPKPLRKKPSLFEKIFIRGAIIIILALLFALGYWYFVAKKVLPVIEKPPVEEVIPPEEVPEKPEVPPEIIPPPTLISVTETKTLEISENIQIPDSISQTLKEELKEEAFTRILIKNVPENRWASLQEFLEAFQIKTPENFYQKLGERYTLFIYSQGALGKRLGFITKIADYYPPATLPPEQAPKENLADLLRSWEETMEGDTEGLFTILGKEEPALVPYFRNGDYKEVAFRFQTFTRADLGICYSIFEDYFILTSSWESITKTIDKLISPR